MALQTAKRHTAPHDFLSTRSCDIAIAGGGLGGLALAVGLHNKGFDVQVFEKAEVLRTATATILGLGSNGFVALTGLDPSIESSLKEAGAQVRSVAMRRALAENNETNTETPFTQDNFYTIRWSKVQNALAGLVPTERVHCDHKLLSYTEEAEHVALCFENHPDVRCRLLVGADGVRSVVRQQMFPAVSPRYLGHMNWNALVYNPNNSVLQVHKANQIAARFDGPDPDWKTMLYLIDAGGGYTFWQVRFQSDEVTFTNGSHPGQGIPGSRERVLERLRSLGWEEGVTAVASTPEASIYERALHDVPPLLSWQRCPGSPVVLLGDAAHALHPGPGLGARSAFEDAHQLTLAVEQHWPDVDAALQQYQEVRLPRMKLISDASAEMCGLPRIRDALRPPGLSAEDRLVRGREFTAWVNQYPRNMAGDPDSTYWKPAPRGEDGSAVSAA